MQNIATAVKQAGVIGAGGGGFPTHVKLQAKVDTVVANGSECEPLLATDKTYLKQKAHLVVHGLHLAMQATGAKQGFVAVKGHYKDVVSAVETAVREMGEKDHPVKVSLLENYYPAGDEFMLVKDVTGRVMPEGGIPLNVGVVVNNVITLAQVAEAVSGKPVTHRHITVAGEVKRPCVVSAPIGAAYEDILAVAGGMTVKDAAVIDGGPMMGRVVTDLKSGIGKTTSGILVLPGKHFVVETKLRTISDEMKKSRSACCQCFRCTDLCPRNSLGHELFPHMTMRTVDYNSAEPAKHVTSAFLCSQCGMCEMVACDVMKLSPRRIFAEYRKRLIQRGVKNPHTRSGFGARENYDWGKVSIPIVLKKLGLEQYVGPKEFVGEVNVSRVRIPLTRHTGAPSKAVVGSGQQVRMCDLVAEAPAEKLGASYHASIKGRVLEVNDEFVEIGA